MALGKQKLTILSSVFFCIVILCVRLPNFYILPFHSGIFLINNIARLLLLSITLLLGYSIFFKKIKYVKFTAPLSILLFIYCVSQTISIIQAINMESFILTYKDFVFAMLIFFIGYQLTSKKNTDLFLKVIILSTIINLLYQVLFYFSPDFFYNLFEQIFNEKYFQFFSYQANRNRFFGDTLDEAIVPIVTYFLLPGKKPIKFILLIVFIGVLIFVSIFSNWRTKTIILMFSLSAGLFRLIQISKKLLLFVLISVIFFLSLGDYVSIRTSGANIIDRFLFPDTTEVKINGARLQYWKEATEIGLSSPVFGVGLGNYYDNLSQISRMAKKNSFFVADGSFVLIDDPHNLLFSTFATTGFFGLFSLLFLLLYFFITDVIFYRRGDLKLNALIFVFWGIFIYAFLNPWMYFSYLMFFWLIRALIEKYKIIVLNEN